MDRIKTEEEAVKVKQLPLARYFMMKNGQRYGPLTPRQMVDLGLTGEHGVWREGLSAWTRVADVPELAKLATKLPPPATAPPVPKPPIESKLRSAGSYATSAVQLTGQVLGSFRKLDLHREVWPLDGASAKAMASDPTFWWVTLLAALPLLFSTLTSADHTLVAFSLFFAGVWALIFCFVVKGERVGWGWRVGCFLFTGLLGTSGLLLCYEVFPAWYLTLRQSPSVSTMLAGYVLQVGLWEELAKSVPVGVLALLLRNRLNHADVVLLGLFSGLGFAAFENLSYFHNQVASSINGAVETVSAANRYAVSSETAFGQLASGAFVTMLLPLVRSLATPFAHAAWAGIVAHFIAVAVRPDARGRRVALIACGVGIAAVLHGLYDGLFSIQPVLPSGVVVVSFMLLRMYLDGQTTATPDTIADAPGQASLTHAGEVAGE